MSERLTARRLVEAGRLEEALSIYQRQDPNDVDGLRTQGTLLLMLRRYGEAAGVFERLDGVLLHQKPAGARALVELAVSRWLANDRVLAVEAAAKDVAELRAGRTIYADFPGGVQNGVVLLYFAHQVGRTDLQNEAFKFLQRLAKSSRIHAWPGELAQFLLGSLGADAVLLKATGSSDSQEALERATENPSALYRMVQTTFVFGLNDLLKNNHASYLDHMRKCASLPNPKLALFWYLAQEVASAPA